VSGPIQEPADWTTLPAVSPDRGVLADHVEVVRQVRAALGPDVPVIQTVFSPLTMAAKLLGNKLPSEHLESEELPGALSRLADDVIAFGQACLRAGVDGFFFATMHANRAVDREIYERLGAPYDARILEAVRPSSSAIMLHLHGQDPYFDLAERYPVDAVSWEDRETSPTLGEALDQTTRCLVGGVGRFHPLTEGTPDEVAAEVGDAIRQTGGRRVIVAPGCTLPVTVAESNLRALLAAVRG
jgi:uroporphyrinogen decarboxylase